MRTHLRLALCALFVAAGLLSADGIATDFEAFSPGTIDGQDGWSSKGAAGAGCAVYDHAVGASQGVAGFGSQSLRISNAVTSGCFADHTLAKPLLEEAGETEAFVTGGSPTTVRHRRFVAEWSFASVVPGAEQPGLSVVVSPDRGDGGRMSWVQMADTPTGLAVNFFDYQDLAPFGTPTTPTDGYGPEDEFFLTNLASGLSRLVPHTIRIEMELYDGPRNDTVKVWVDGTLRHTGTSWEDYFRWTQGLGGPEQTAPVHESRVIRTLLFRTGGTAAPATSGNGFLIDNVSFTSLSADLTETSVSNPPATPPGFGPITVTDTVRNDAATPVSTTFSIGYFLSLDGVRDAADILLWAGRGVGSLAAGASNTASTPAWIPPGIPPGSYYLLACADEGNDIAETNEVNNCTASTTTMRFRKADLVVSALGNPPATLGPTFNVSNTVRNTGGAAAPSTVLRFYLSLDTARDGGDVTIATTRTVPALGAGGSSSATTTLTRPSAPAGLYYVIACADGSATVDEESEANNCRTSSGRGRIP